MSIVAFVNSGGAITTAQRGNGHCPKRNPRLRISAADARLAKLTILGHDRSDHGTPGAHSMASGTRNIRMLISQDCFAFLANAMCEFSKKTARFQSLRATVQHACSSASSMEIARADLDRFLAEYPVEGKVKVWLEVGADWLDDYDTFRRKVAQVGGKPVQDKAVIPFLIHLAQVRGVF
ncbi:hypothetical protein [Novosphingobium sp. ES2-1]|uniref:hypothetical protein n=1 Tax=Novosphingobium sp. ES2-1 TaxID=2780074 RepID=UPI001E60EC9E|nr:hypothetical protein [Novosphingobium sp. ES2-1]